MSKQGREEFLKNVKFFFGVVEDRQDPLRLGRVRVRAIGVHTEDKSILPTEDLPWATMLNDITNPAVSGYGRTPTGLIPGTWVMGIFIDGEDRQQPFILGSIAGIPQDKQSNQVGFTDPRGIIPRSNTEVHGLGESDLSRSADERAETDPRLISKRNAKRALGNVEIAIGSRLDNNPDKEDVYYTRRTWAEPHPRYGTHDAANGQPASIYPYNHVWSTESGHLFEVDDTPGAGRLHWYHRAGTFEEIQNDGTRVTKVVGDDYEINIKDKNVQIVGNCNVTIEGSAHLLIKGDRTEEVTGNYFLTVGGDVVTKIGGNEAKEIGTDKATTVASNTNFYTGLNLRETIKDSRIIDVGNNQFETVGNNNQQVVGNSYVQAVANSIVVAAGVNIDHGAGDKYRVGAANNVRIKSSGANVYTEAAVDLNVNVGSNMNEVVGGNLDEQIGGTQTTNVTGKIDIDSGSEVDVDAPTINLN